MDADGVLAAHALDSFATELSVRPDADALYCDSDRIDDDGRRHDPHFKPEWSPDTLVSRDYVGRLAFLRRGLVEAAGGFRAGFQDSEEWDLLLRMADRTHRFARIADVLYHDGRTVRARPEGERAVIADAIRRRGEPGSIDATDDPGTYVVRYAVRAPARATIVVPTRDGAEDVDRCLRSVFERSTYADFDVILVDNGSTDPRRSTYSPAGRGASPGCASCATTRRSISRDSIIRRSNSPTPIS